MSANFFIKTKSVSPLLPASRAGARSLIRYETCCCFLLSSLALAVCLLASCSEKKAPPALARPVTDEIGRVVMVVPRPARIISLAPSITEVLFALGAGDRVVGVTSYCDYPPEATTKEKVGDTQRPGLEKVVALKPDLVIVSTASQLERFVARLDEIAIPVYASNSPDLEGVFKSIEKLGDLIGEQARAQELVKKLRARAEAVQSRVAGSERPRVLFIIGSEPLITIGGKSFVNDLINRAGGKSISADQQADYPQYSLETAIAAEPEIIFLQSGERELNARLKDMPAARAGKVFSLPDELLLRPGPRVIDGLEQMAARIHPEAFTGSARLALDNRRKKI